VVGSGLLITSAYPRLVVYMRPHQLHACRTHIACWPGPVLLAWDCCHGSRWQCCISLVVLHSDRGRGPGWGSRKANRLPFGYGAMGPCHSSGAHGHYQAGCCLVACKVANMPVSGRGHPGSPVWDWECGDAPGIALEMVESIPQTLRGSSVSFVECLVMSYPRHLLSGALRGGWPSISLGDRGATTRGL
jgi:hypothetical protein